MSRATRIEFPGALYHAMGRGIGGMKVFGEEEDFRKFLDLVGEKVESQDLLIHAFCLMSNHYHLLLETPRGGLSRWMHDILGTYAEWFNFTRKRRGHLWQGRYKAILVERGPYLLECSRYIHLNPNRAGLTRSAERWEWSSYRNYVSALGKVRSILATMLVSRSGLRPAEVARYLGVSRSAVAKSTIRSDQALASDPGLAKRVRLITARILEKNGGEA